MDINDRLYVEIVPMAGPHAPRPHPVDDGRFDPAFVYKVLGSYNPSETSECYFVLANRDREIWFIPQRHLRAFRLIDSDEFSIPKSPVEQNGHQSGSTNKTGMGSTAIDPAQIFRRPANCRGPAAERQFGRTPSK